MQKLERNKGRQHKGLERICEAAHGTQYCAEVWRKDGDERRAKDDGGADEIDERSLHRLRRPRFGVKMPMMR